MGVPSVALAGDNADMDEREGGLHIDLVQDERGVVVNASGKLDWSTAGEFDSAMRELSSRYDGAQIVLDLREVDFVDLDGLDAVARAGHRTITTGPMTLRPPATRRHMFDIDDVASSFTIDS